MVALYGIWFSLNYLVRLTAFFIVYLEAIALFGQQIPENHKAIPLSGSINSEFEESKPITSITGDTLYFVRSHHPENIGGTDAGSDIWVSYRNSLGEWSIPSNSLEALNTAAHNQVIGISSDGLTLYCVNYFAKDGKRYVKIMQSSQQVTRWTEPTAVDIDPILLPDGYHEFYMHPSGKVLLLSMRGIDSLGEEDLYISIFTDGIGWSRPQNVGAGINTPGFEISPFLSEDMTHLYFASNGYSGNGDSDIWVSKRLDKSFLNWSKPLSMGNEINSNRFDAFYFENNQGEVYFTSNRDQALANIFSLETFTANTSVDALPSTLESNSILETGKSQNLILFFDLDREDLNHPEFIRLQKYLESLPKERIQKITIYGYTDHTGNAGYNMNLSKRRATYTGNVVKSILANDNSNISYTINGKGVYPSNSSRDEMRRVEISIYLVEGT